MQHIDRLVAGIVVVVSPALFGCHRAQSVESGKPAAAELLILAGVTDVKQQSNQGVGSVSYEMQAPFPAAAQIAEILTHMSGLGWVPLKEDSLNPGIPTSIVRGWTSFIDASKPKRVRRWGWSGEWRSKRGDITSYRFAYEAPETATEPLSHVRVSGSLVPAEIERRIEDELKRRSPQHQPQRSALPPGFPDEGFIRTVLDARLKDCFLASNHLGDAVVQVVGMDGAQVSYRWKFLGAGHEGETSGTAPSSSSIQAGPFHLAWSSPVTDETASGVGYYPAEMSLIPLPADSFESIDLAQVRRLATLTPETTERYRGFHVPPEQAAHDRTSALFIAGKTAPIHMGEAFLISGEQGRAVVEIENVTMKSVRYHWRFRKPSSREDSSGTDESGESPLPSIRVGPYAMFWQMNSLRSYRDEKTNGTTDWRADIRYLPEEVSVVVIPQAKAGSVDLSSAKPPAP